MSSFRWLSPPEWFSYVCIRSTPDIAASTFQSPQKMAQSAFRWISRAPFWVPSVKVRGTPITTSSPDEYVQQKWKCAKKGEKASLRQKKLISMTQAAQWFTRVLKWELSVRGHCCCSQLTFSARAGRSTPLMTKSQHSWQNFTLIYQVSCTWISGDHTWVHTWICLLGVVFGVFPLKIVLVCMLFHHKKKTSLPTSGRAWELQYISVCLQKLEDGTIWSRCFSCK